jgi:two-component system sensor histidine kinase KdpD
VLASSEKLHQALLSSVSHELKTPLTAIIGNASALKQDGQTLSENGKVQALGDLIESSERLNRVVENLLDMTRISSGALKVRDDIFGLNDFVDSSISRYASVIKNHTVNFKKSSQEVFVKGDDKLLEHVLSNLLSNAAYYAPRGSEIRIEVSSDEGFGKVVVTDEGPGIPEDSIEKVFDRFYRVPGTPTGGTGLGLSIAKALVLAMGGTISVQNRNNQSGSAFTFTLPRTNIRFDKDGILN